MKNKGMRVNMNKTKVRVSVSDRVRVTWRRTESNVRCHVGSGVEVLVSVLVVKSLVCK